MEHKSVQISDIYIEPGFNCRRSFTAQSVKSLAESISREGLFIPIILQPVDGIKDKLWKLIAGHRRVKAVKLYLKWETIDATIVDLTAKEAKVLNLVENFERSDLNLIEEALSLDDMYQDLSEKDLAKLLGRGRTWVKVRRLALKLEPLCQGFLSMGLLSQNDILLLSETPPEGQAKLARSIVRRRRSGKPPKVGDRRVGRRPKSRKDIRIMITMIADRYGVTEVSTVAGMCLAWVSNDLSDDELLYRLDGFQG